MNKLGKILTDTYRSLIIPFKEAPLYIVALFVFILLPGILSNIVVPPIKRVVLADICQALAFSYLLGWLGVSVRHSGRSIIAVLIALISCVVSLSIIIPWRPFSTVTILLVTQTDGREAASFFHQFLTPSKVVSCVVLLLFYAALLLGVCRRKYRGKFGKAIPRKLKSVLAACAIFPAVIGLVRVAMLTAMFRYDSLYEFERWYSKPSALGGEVVRLEEFRRGDLITSATFALRGYYLNIKEMPKWEAYQRELLNHKFEHCSEVDSINIVMVIGESFIKGHSNLYGYPLMTNPHLTAEHEAGRLVVFNDFISTANFTAESLRNTLNLNDLLRRETWSASAYFPLLLSKSGWRVHLYDNQFTKPEGISDVQLATMMRHQMMEEYCYHWTNDSIDDYDGDFIQRVNRTFPFDRSTGNFDIFHLYGQHFAPADRYPHNPEYNHFTVDSLPYDRPWFTDEKKRVIAEYDNATLYNDEVVAKIIARYNGTPTLIVYFSDHGEEMYDTSDCNVRNEPSGDLKGWLRRQFEIPFFVWASDEFIERFPDKWQSVVAARDRAGMLDNLGQAVLGMAGWTDSDFYRPERDIFNPAYRATDRITSEGSVNYDRTMSGDR